MRRRAFVVRSRRWQAVLARQRRSTGVRAVRALLGDASGQLLRQSRQQRHVAAGRDRVAAGGGRELVRAIDGQCPIRLCRRQRRGSSLVNNGKNEVFFRNASNGSVAGRRLIGGMAGPGSCWTRTSSSTTAASSSSRDRPAVPAACISRIWRRTSSAMRFGIQTQLAFERDDVPDVSTWCSQSWRVLRCGRHRRGAEGVSRHVCGHHDSLPAVPMVYLPLNLATGVTLTTTRALTCGGTRPRARPATTCTSAHRRIRRRSRPSFRLPACRRTWPGTMYQGGHEGVEDNVLLAGRREEFGGIDVERDLEVHDAEDLSRGHEMKRADPSGRLLADLPPHVSWLRPSRDRGDPKEKEAGGFGNLAAGRCCWLPVVSLPVAFQSLLRSSSAPADLRLRRPSC